MKIDLNSKLIPNVQIYVVNGNWSGVLLEDCVTRELLFHISGEGQTKATTRRIDRDQTFDQMFPDYDLRFSKPSLKISNLPFTFDEYATDDSSIYQIIYKEGQHLVTLQPLEVTVFVRNLVTDKISQKKVSELSIRNVDNQFHKDLVSLVKSSDLSVRSYLKAAYEYSDFFRTLIEHSKIVIGLESEAKFKDLLKEVLGDEKLNTRGRYFVNGDDIQYYTFLEDDTVVVLKTCHTHRFSHNEVSLLSRTEYTLEEFKDAIAEIVKKHEVSLTEAIEIFNDPSDIVRTRYSVPYSKEFDRLTISN